MPLKTEDHVHAITTMPHTHCGSVSYGRAQFLFRRQRRALISSLPRKAFSKGLLLGQLIQWRALNFVVDRLF